MGVDDSNEQRPTRRLHDRSDEIYAPSGRLMVAISERDGWQEIGIAGNRIGLKALAAICSDLAELTDEELLTPANHFHLEEGFWDTEKGSIPLTVLCRERGWPEAMNRSLM